VLERNRRYWSPENRGSFDRIVFRILPEDPVAYRSLVSGDLDETRHCVFFLILTKLPSSVQSSVAFSDERALPYH